MTSQAEADTDAKSYYLSKCSTQENLGFCHLTASNDPNWVYPAHHDAFGPQAYVPLLWDQSGITSDTKFEHTYPIFKLMK